MEIFIGWVVLSVIIGAIGTDRKIGFFFAFLSSLLLSPLIGLIITLSSMRLATEKFQRDMLQAQQNILIANSVRECPFCAEEIKTNAVICKHCGRDIPPPAKLTDREILTQSSEKTLFIKITDFIVIAIVVALLIMILIAVFK